jgi:hypothetical protein
VPPLKRKYAKQTRGRLLWSTSLPVFPTNLSTLNLKLRIHSYVNSYVSSYMELHPHMTRLHTFLLSHKPYILSLSGTRKPPSQFHHIPVLRGKCEPRFTWTGTWFRKIQFRLKEAKYKNPVRPTGLFRTRKWAQQSGGPSSVTAAIDVVRSTARSPTLTRNSGFQVLPSGRRHWWLQQCSCERLPHSDGHPVKD